MTAQTPFRVYFSEGEAVVQELSRNIAAAGLRVVKTFDLRAACATLTDNVCPHHGTAPCDCQLVVLQVYGIGSAPVSLILHSHRARTELHWDAAPEFRPDPAGRERIIRALEGGDRSPLTFHREVRLDAG